MKTITPLFDNVLIKPEKVEERTATGIYIPEVKEKPHFGSVVAVGKGKESKGGKYIMDVKIGDKVIYKKWSGNEVKLEGEEWVLVGQEDIIGLIK